MRKYGKWVLTLSLLASTPGITLAASQKSKDANPTTATRSTRTDNQRVAEEIANAMRGKVQGDISIEYKDGTAVLSGTVMDARVKKLAETLAGKVSSVSKVDNRLGIMEKKRAYSERLRGEDADGGVVQATHGSESTDRRHVQQVNNEFDEMPPISYKSAQAPAPTTSPNQEIAEQIGAALSAAQLDGYDIQIRFQNGTAMLDGRVGTQAERNAASRVVSAVPGVRSVQNRLMPSEQPPAQAGYQGGPNGYGPPRGDVRGAGYMQPGMQAGYGGPGGPGGPGQAYPAGYQQGPPMGGAAPMGPGGMPPYPPAYGNQGMGASQAVYNSPSMPDHAWPTYAQYPNSAAVSYPQQYSASAWPYIGPFYPYPQVPLGWRDATLRWDDGQWNLMFKPRTDRWWWFLNPNNW